MFRRALIILGICSILLPEMASAQELAIPRFVSFRHNKINLRTGPGNRYPIKYVYQVQNYPVEVIDEYELWRQIREVDGTVGWVHRRMLSGVRYIIMTQEDTLYKEPNNKSQAIATVQQGSLAKLEQCPPQSAYCEVMFTFNDKKYEGWMNKKSFYGIYPHEVIN